MVLQPYIRVSEGLRRFRDDLSGATAIEYGLLAAGIAVVIIAAVLAIGTNLTTTFERIRDCLSAAGCPAPAGGG